MASVQFYGKPVLAIMAWGDYEGLTETLEIMNDPQVMESSRRAARQIQDGSGREFEEFAAELGIQPPIRRPWSQHKPSPAGTG